jgi:hypothetical protein
MNNRIDNFDYVHGRISDLDKTLRNLIMQERKEVDINMFSTIINELNKIKIDIEILKCKIK